MKKLHLTALLIIPLAGIFSLATFNLASLNLLSILYDGGGATVCSSKEETCLFITETDYDPSVSDANNKKGYPARSLSAENMYIKVVWNHDPYDTHGNRGGGNIYEIYDKRNDPDKRYNLVSEESFGGASSGPPHAGIGGLGATYIYDLAFKGLASDGPRSDNGGMARPAKDENGLDLPQIPPHVDENGNLIVEVKLDVYDSLWSSGYCVRNF